MNKISAAPVAFTVDQMQAMMDDSPFIAFCQLKVLSFDNDRQQLVVRCPLRPEFERGRGSRQWHGGPIASLIDTAGDCALIMLLGRGIPTINFRVDYLRPAVDTDLIATATVRRLGRSIGTSDVDVTDEKGALIAIGRGTFSTAVSG
jgi:uncharacterized protein (TIGR00369 family)